jgi:hypothetical protein
MPPPDPKLHFMIKMALRNALKLVPGLRKQIREIDEDIMASKLITEIGQSNYQIVRLASAPGHTFETPTGP